MTTRRTRQTRRGAEAGDAAVEAFETARLAAAADIVSSDEALEWLAHTVGRELDLGIDEEPGDEPA
ncbi:MAG: hypothetical protein WD638_12525 [Nitriliruptoraceae bacterium]